MELEEMQKAWTEMSGKIEKQEKLTDKLIMDMTAQKYSSRLRNISIPEAVGSVVCLAEAGLILFNISNYDTAFLLACGIISAMILLLLAAFSIRAIYGMHAINIGEDNYKQVLTRYTKARRRFISFQKRSMYLGFILLITILPVMVKIIGGKEAQIPSGVWLWYLPAGFLFFLFFVRLIYRYYLRITVRLDSLVKDLEE